MIQKDPFLKIGLLRIFGNCVWGTFPRRSLMSSQQQIRKRHVLNGVMNSHQIRAFMYKIQVLISKKSCGCYLEGQTHMTGMLISRMLVEECAKLGSKIRKLEERWIIDESKFHEGYVRLFLLNDPDSTRHFLLLFRDEPVKNSFTNAIQSILFYIKHLIYSIPAELHTKYQASMGLLVLYMSTQRIMSIIEDLEGLCEIMVRIRK